MERALDLAIIEWQVGKLEEGNVLTSLWESGGTIASLGGEYTDII